MAKKAGAGGSGDENVLSPCSPALQSSLQNRGGAPQWNGKGTDGRLKASVRFWRMESKYTVATDRDNTVVMKPGCRQDGESNTWLQLPKDPQKAWEWETPESPEGGMSGVEGRVC